MTPQADLAIYHGNEVWALRGLAIDFEKAFQAIGLTTVRTDKVFQKVGQLDAKYHLFVNQGQCYQFASNNREIPRNSISLFTHMVAKRFQSEVKLLNLIKGITFFSQQQEALALSNGISNKNTKSIIMAGDPSKHKIISSHNMPEDILNQYGLKNKRKYIGFCLKFWDKQSYQERKNYSKIIEVINSLTKLGLPCLILGPGWQDASDISPKVLLIEAKYDNYEYIYNQIKVYVSLSLNEGGPLPLLESMMCGCTPVATTVGYAPELMLPFHGNGLLTPMATSNEITNKIISIYYANHLIDETSKFAQQYSFNNAAAIIYEMFQK